MEAALEKRMEGGAEITVHDADVRSFKDADLALIDQQIATAKRYPRRLAAVLENIETMVTIDRQVAESMFYSLERREKGGQKVFIRGPSIRMAEAFGSAWGNLRVETRIVGEEGGRWVVAEAVAADLETNTAAKVQVRRRITTKGGRRYSDDMVGVTAAAAQSIAYRNALFRVIPRVYVERAQRQAEDIVLGGAAGLQETLQRALEFFDGHGLTKEQVLAALQLDRAEEVRRQDILNLMGFATRMKDGDMTVGEFVELGQPDESGPSAAQALNATLKGEDPQAEPTAAPEEKTPEKADAEPTAAPSEDAEAAAPDAAEQTAMELPLLLQRLNEATEVHQLHELTLPDGAPAEEWQMADAFAKRCENKLSERPAYSGLGDGEKQLCRKALGMLK